MANLPDIRARLDADVQRFIDALDRAADAAERAAARIRAATQGAGNGPDTSRWRDFEAELERMTRTVRQATDRIREMGNSSRDAGRDVDTLGESARGAADRLNDLGRGGGMAGRMLGPMGVAVGVIASILPAVAAAALATGAALQALGVVGGVIALGWKGLEDAGNRLKASLHGLSAQISSIFRSGLSQEFSKLGQAISSLDGPLKGIARSIVDVVKEFTGWIRSSQGMSEIKTLLAGVNDFVQNLRPGVRAIAEAFTGWGAAAGPVLKDIGAAISSVFVELNKVIQEAKKSGDLTKAFENGAKAIEAFGKVLGGVLEVLIQMAAQGGEPAASAIGKFGDALKNGAPAIGAFFASLAKTADSIMTLVDWVSKALGAMGKFGEVIGQVSGALSKGLALGQWQELGQLFAGLGGVVAQGVAKAVTAINEWWDKTSASIREGIDKAISAVKDWVTKNLAAIKAGNDKAIQLVKDWVTKKVSDIKAGLDKAVQAVKDWVTKNLAAIKAGNDKAIQLVKDWVGRQYQAIKDGVDKAIQAVKDWWEKTKEDVQAGVEAVVQFVATLPEKIMNALSGWVQDMLGIGKDAIDGIAQGMGQAVGNLIGTATRIAQQAMAAIKGALGIRSPSKLFADEVGVHIPGGIAEGILRNAGAVTDAMRRAGLTGTAGYGMTASVRTMASGGGVRGGGGVAGGGFTLHVAPGSDSAVATMIMRLAQQGKLKITANAVVR